MLTETIPLAGSLVAKLQVYDWTTGALMHVWPVALGHAGGGGLVVHAASPRWKARPACVWSI